MLIYQRVSTSALFSYGSTYHHAAVAVVEVEGHRRRLLGEAGPWRLSGNLK